MWGWLCAPIHLAFLVHEHYRRCQVNMIWYGQLCCKWNLYCKAALPTLPYVSDDDTCWYWCPQIAIFSLRMDGKYGVLVDILHGHPRDHITTSLSEDECLVFSEKQQRHFLGMLFYLVLKFQLYWKYKLKLCLTIKHNLEQKFPFFKTSHTIYFSISCLTHLCASKSLPHTALLI